MTKDYPEDGYKMAPTSNNPNRGQTMTYDPHNVPEELGEVENEVGGLIEYWRKRAQWNRNVGQRHDANQIEQCADELEELVTKSNSSHDGKRNSESD